MIQSANLALRFLLELCALAAMGYWGFHAGKGTLVKWLLGLGAPLLIAVVWGAFGSPKAAYPAQGALRLLLELAVFGIPALALYAAGAATWAVVYAVVVVINRILMAVWGQ